MRTQVRSRWSRPPPWPERAWSRRRRKNRHRPVRYARHRGRRILLVAISAVLILILAAGGVLYQRQSAYDHNVRRIPGALPSGTSRPAPSVPHGTENWLLVGTNNRLRWSTAGQTWLPGHQQSDTMMLIQLPADHKTAYVISIPGNSWVTVPAHGQQKLSTAFLDGGPPLLAETVESLTGVRVDHFAALNFEGFETMTNALGGVRNLTGEQALQLVTQRSGLPGDEIVRIQRQQELLRALTAKAVSGGTILNPLKLNAFLEALTKSISVDSSVTGGRLRGLVLSLSGLRTGNIRFLTAPVTATATAPASR